MVFKDKIFIFLIISFFIVAFFVFGLFQLNRDEFLNTQKEPVYSKGIYMTYRTAGNYRANELLELIKKTELNSIVIDVKDYTGRVGFDTDSELINHLGSEKIFVDDMKALVDKFHNAGIYTIARIVVFEDNYLPREKPDLALKTVNGNLWRDNRGLSWLDPASQEVWDYVVEISREAVKVGFDEINLDYVRFPTDGNISAIRYPFWDYEISKKEVIRQFFEYVSERIKPMGVFLSVDLFGYTLTSKTDLNIGQWLEYAAPYVDYISPMIYPSHYPPGHNGLANPAAYPYETIYSELVVGIERLASMSSQAKIRPWLQDFDIGANYDARMIELQKQAVYDSGAYGWLFWNPRNVYTEEGLIKE